MQFLCHRQDRRLDRGKGMLDHRLDAGLLKFLPGFIADAYRQHSSTVG